MDWGYVISRSRRESEFLGDNLFSLRVADYVGGLLGEIDHSGGALRFYGLGSLARGEQLGGLEVDRVVPHDMANAVLLLVDYVAGLLFFTELALARLLLLGILYDLGIFYFVRAIDLHIFDDELRGDGADWWERLVGFSGVEGGEQLRLSELLEAGGAGGRPLCVESDDFSGVDALHHLIHVFSLDAVLLDPVIDSVHEDLRGGREEQLVLFLHGLTKALRENRL